MGWRIGLAAAALLVPAAASAFQDYQVYGEIGRKWAQLQGTAGPLGAARSSEADAERGGRFNNFQHGFIYWHPRFGAHAVYGLIGEKWNSMGRERGLGYPLTDEMAGPNGGRFNDFERNASISWHPRAGTHAVYGYIRDEWVRRGREGGGCGYPIRDEYDIAGGRRSDFQRGSISWRRGTSRAVASCAVIIDEGTRLIPADE
jgi:uncharacterized protein with LGFP repeats